MSQKLITVLLLLIAAISLIYINFITDWILIVIGLLFSTISLLSASFLLLLRYKKQCLISYEKF